MDVHRTFSWELPTRLVVGPGCARTAGVELRKLGATRALIVTDRGIEDAGILASVIEGLTAEGVTYSVFNGVEPNPSIRCVEAAAEQFKMDSCDCMLAVGGGSSIDTAKAAGAVMSHPEMDIRAMQGVDKIYNLVPPLVAVPTTCGTGAEVTNAAVVTDPERHRKMPIASFLLAPKVALIDAALLTKLPGPIVASTGLDALCHAIESCTHLNTNPISDALDFHAISMISRWLRPAVANANLEAMSNMVLASTMAGMAFANARTCLVHALSHPVSAFFGVPHGVANAILLPHVMEFCLIGNPEAFANVARAMGEDTTGTTTMEAARLSLKAVRELSRDVGIPSSFEPFGVTEEHFDTMVEDTFRSYGIPVSPVRITAEDVVRLYRLAIKGEIR